MDTEDMAHEIHPIKFGQCQSSRHLFKYETHKIHNYNNRNQKTAL